jgi:hypothetical protein
MITNLLDMLNDIKKDVPLLYFNGTPLYIDDFLLLCILIILLKNPNCDFTLVCIIAFSIIQV